MTKLLGLPQRVVRGGVSVRVADNRLTLAADDDLVGIATEHFAEPSCGVLWSTSSLPDDVEFVGYAFTQFALPVVGGSALDFEFRPAPGLRSPAVVSPLIARSGDDVVLLAPVDQFHEQVIAVTPDGLMWGWHGDLDEVPAGFTSTLGIYEGRSVEEVLAAWRSDLDASSAPPVEHAGKNALSTHLSYWTDNGAAYWYRTESGRSITESVEHVVADLREQGVPIRSVELDSWSYRHETARPIAEIGYPEEVPPTGMLEWTARPDAFPGGDPDPIRSFADRVGLPLSMHARHISPASPYVTGPEEWWIDELAAHPKDPTFFRRWFDDAVRWGVTCIEQDWMLMFWFGVRELRSAPDRAAAWQRSLNEHAGSTDVDLLWCMATPADLMLAASLDRVIAVRTCDDYRFADDSAFLWTWFLTVNRLANTLGLLAYKDCFFSRASVTDTDDAIDGDEHAELEAVLAALSGGPVGLGDRLGHTDREIVLRTCDADGRLRRVDRAIAAIDDCLFGAPERGERLMWATTTATVGSEVWTYVLAINTASTRGPIVDRFDLGNERVVYDWRGRSTSRSATLDVELEPRGWALFVVGSGDASEHGDASKYVVVEADRVARP